MKVIFRKNFNFLRESLQKRNREEENAPEESCQVGGQVAQLEGPTACQQKITRRPGQDGAQQIDAHPSAAHLHRIDEHGHRDGQPEEKIQNAAHCPPGQAHPQHPQQVVQQAHRHAQEEGTQERVCLLRD